MIYTIEKLQTDVMTRLGELARPLPSLSDTSIPSPPDVVALKTKSLLAEVGSRLIRKATVDMLGNGMPIEGVVTMRQMPCGLYAAEVTLPDDFLRLVSLKMSGWERGVRGVILPGTPDWSRQWSAEEGIAGSPAKPQVYSDVNGSVGILRAVGSRAMDEELEWFCGWRVPVVDGEGRFDFPAGLYGELLVGMCEGV